ncbi:MAG: DUF1501 domain-containing protein [Pedosphaera sp.]|nr:DUF1501 domain-containing protein [Pedosphaera sp.]
MDKHCRGLASREISRRSFIQTSVIAGTAGFSLPTLLAARAQAGEPVRNNTAVIQIWLGGGPTQFETYDPKPEAPQEYRGPLGAIPTKLDGVRICEVLPRHAKILDKAVLLRSVFHNSSDHNAGMYICTTGKTMKDQPSTGSYVARVRGATRKALPPFVHLGFTQTDNLVFVPNHKANHLGSALDPFYVYDDPSVGTFQVPNLGLADGLTVDRLQDRRGVLTSLDGAMRVFDKRGVAEAMDGFSRTAFDLVTSPRAREAFDLSKEPTKLREDYGLHRWGQSCLLARRLVEAGVTFVTVNFDPHSYTFDMHGNVKGAMESAGPRMDSAIPALIEDLFQRGMDKDVLVIVWGEFGRTPRVNASAGRDHWGQVMSVLMSGGGLRMGQAIGTSNERGEEPKDRPIKPQDILATMYRHLGIDTRTTFNDHTGRPISLLSEGEVIRELV